MGAGAAKPALPTEEAARRLFDEIDTNQNGRLSIDELVAAAQSYAKEIRRSWSHEQITVTFAALDLDHDGSLDFQEFVAGLDMLVGAKRSRGLGRRSQTEAKQAQNAEQMRMIEEAKRLSAAANASLEAVGMATSAGGHAEDEDKHGQAIDPEVLDRRRSQAINDKVSAKPARARE